MSGSKGQRSKPSNMSFFQPNMLTTLNSSKFDEGKWIKQIRQTLDEELEEETHENPVTIFTVPKTLMISDPDCYIPRQVAIGPYHHLRAELYDMERYKVAAAKRNQKELQNVKLHQIVDHITKFELRIRSSYQRPLDYSCEALAWMMAVDVSFLFEFFQVCGIKEAGKVLTKVPSRLEHLIGFSRNKTVHNAILRDVVMLENQIPLFVMRMLLEFQCSSLEMADEKLFDMLTAFSKELSPFKTTVESGQKIEVKECDHLLDFLYNFILPRVDSQVIDIDDDEEEGENHKEGDDEEKDDSFSKPSHLRVILDELWKILSGGPLLWIKSIVFSKPLKFIVKLPWLILSRIPILNMLKEPIENMFSAFSDGNEKKDDEEPGSNSENNIDKPLLQEEIAIPSVSQLLEVGVQLMPIHEGIMSINFDEKNLIFHIPVIDLDVNSEVALRNLVAYEACSVKGPLVLSRYTELMNGIIDTDVDAKLLCERGIIVNHLKSEKEVAELWNGMCKSIRLTKVPSLDKVIGDVNRFYNGRWKVKFGKFMKEYVFGSWKILTFFAAVLFLLLMGLQAFCQVYSCSRFFPIKALEPTNQE